MRVPCSLMRPSHCFSAVMPDHCLAHCSLAASDFDEICWGFGTTCSIVSWNWVWIRTVFSFFIFKIDVWPFQKLTPRSKDLKNAATNISQCYDLSYHDIWRSAPHRSSILGFHECKWIFSSQNVTSWHDLMTTAKQNSLVKEHEARRYRSREKAFHFTSSTFLSQASTYTGTNFIFRKATHNRVPPPLSQGHRKGKSAKYTIYCVFLGRKALYLFKLFIIKHKSQVSLNARYLQSSILYAKKLLLGYTGVYFN